MKKILAIIAMLAAGTAAFAQKKDAIAVPEPKGVNLSEDTKWITLFIQGLITSNFQQYSGLTVIDRQNADMVKAEQRLSESAEFDEKNTVELGKMTNARLTVTGNIMAKSGAYALTFNITDVETGETKASASVPNCLRSALEDGTAANQISYDLMTGYGIALSDDARKNLTQKTGVMTAATSAQVSVAKGIVAEQSGSNIEALTYYIQARKNDNKLAEATSRMATMTQVISTGNFGTNLKNMIKLRDDWDKLLTEVAEMLCAYKPIFTLYYSSDIRAEPLKAKNYDDRTVTFSVPRPILVLENADEALQNKRLVDNIKKTLAGIPESKNWGAKINKFPESYIYETTYAGWGPNIGYGPGSNHIYYRELLSDYKKSYNYFVLGDILNPRGDYYEINSSNDPGLDKELRYHFVINLLDKNKKKMGEDDIEFYVTRRGRKATEYDFFVPMLQTGISRGNIKYSGLTNRKLNTNQRIYFDVPADYADSDVFYVTAQLKSVDTVKFIVDDDYVPYPYFNLGKTLQDLVTILPYEESPAAKQEKAKAEEEERIRKNNMLVNMRVDKQVKEIARNSFGGLNLENVERVYIPKSVKKINWTAFKKCKALKEIYLEASFNSSAKNWVDLPSRNGNGDDKAVTWTLEGTNETWCTMYFKVTEKSIKDLDTFTVIK